MKKCVPVTIPSPFRNLRTLFCLMFRLISFRRQPDQLIIELKRRFSSEMILSLALVSLFLFLVLAAMVGPWVILLVGFGGAIVNSCV